MMVSSSSPLQRVHEILQRMQTDMDNVECLKTCCGALAILAKDEANKLLIARDGTRLILTVMEGHATRPDLQEAVCDLLWSLAFNNSLVKEVVGRQGGIALILKGMSSHLSSPDLIKSACGALSNMCQNTYNQNLIASHGGVRTILSAMQSHRMNAPLLPFVFDALASLIVGNQRNGLLVTDGGGIRGVLATMALHNGRRDVVKSGCHTLAILSDIQGQGARIAGADGVKVLLPALRVHVRFLHLHRIAAIVLLRMLQEAAVARDIAVHGGVVIMLGMLREHAREEETVAASVHILYLITHADVMRGAVEVEVGRHFDGIAPASPLHERTGLRGVAGTLSNSHGVLGASTGGGSTSGAQGGGGGVDCSSMTDRELFSTYSVRALVMVLQAHMERKDIVRAAMRSAANLIRLRSVVRALVSEGSALSTVLHCLALHSTSRGITDSAVAVAGALLAAAHEGGWESISSAKEKMGCRSKSPVSRLDAGAGASNFKLSVVGGTPNGVVPNDRSPQRQQQQQQHHQHQHQHQLAPHATAAAASGKMMMSTRSSSGGVDLRFAYTPLHDVRSGSAVATGLRGQGGAKTAAVLAPASSSAAPTAVGKACATAGDPADTRRGTGAGARGTATSADAAKSRPRPPPGDAGGWSASMQALCAMLRARRRDPALAGLVFLALTACIGEWAQACDAHTTAGLPEQSEEKRRAAAPAAATATARGWGWRACPPAATDMVVVARETATLQSVPPRDKPPGAAAMFRRAPARFLPQHGGMLHGHLLGGGGAKGKDTGGEVTATPRGKLCLGIRESIKAGLVWAEAVPLYRCRTAAEGLDGDGRGSSSIGGRDGAVGAAAEHAAASSAADVSCSPVMAEAVGRLCRLLSKGFAEMGFGHLENAVPLGEELSLEVFDANVPEVLENLRTTQQPGTSQECVKNLMSKFLLEELPDLPQAGHQEDIPNATIDAGCIPAAPAATSPTPSPPETASDGKEADTAVSGERASSNSSHPRRLNAGKAPSATGGGSEGGGGSSTSSSASNASSGRAGYPSGSGGGGSGGGGNGGGGGSVFCDEASAGSAGLVMSSPVDLEPILLPASSSSLSAASTTFDAAAAPPPEKAAAGSSAYTAMTAANGLGGTAPGAYPPVGQGALPSRYPSGSGDDRLWLVYDGVSAAGKGVISKVNAPDPYWLGRASPGVVCPHAHSMEFHSSFESANLLRAVQRGPAEYDIFLRPDLHTHGHTQWFYFAVRDTHPPGMVGESVVKFNVINLTKPDSLFAMGMRPVLYSHQDAAEKGLGWRRCGHGIDYRSNGYSWYKPDGSQASFYTLSLSVTFSNPGDTYRLAHAHPYSYSDHKRHLAKLLADERTAKFLNHTVLCTTIGGNECDLLTITDSKEAPITAMGNGKSDTGGLTHPFTPDLGQQQQQQHDGYLLGTNGVHYTNRERPEPSSVGEGVAAVVAAAAAVTAAAEGGDIARGGGEGTVNGAGELGICGASSGFGGAVGGGAGWDGGAGAGASNRRGNHKRCVVISARVHPGETPASWMMRGMLDFITGDSAEARLLRSLFVFKIVPMLNPDGVAYGNNRCSLAGVDLNRQWKKPSRALHPTVFWLKQHIRQEQAKRGVAMYVDLHGHSRKMNIFMYGADEKRRGLSCPSARVFPKLLSWNRLGRKYVSFKDCSFAVKKGRESTARVVVARDLGIGNSYTVESTFCGVDFGPLKDHHLNTDHLQEAGVAICDALLDYYLPNQAQRERAHRDLMARDGVAEERGGGLTVAPPTIIAPAVGRISSEGGRDGRAGGSGSCCARGDENERRQDGEARDVDDDVVDNNDDIASEDDNDSEPPEVSPGNADADPDTDLATLSPRHTPPDVGKGFNTRPSVESGISGQQFDVGTTLVSSERVSGSGGNHGGSGRATENTAGVGSRAREECNESYGDMMGNERGRGWGLQTAGGHAGRGGGGGGDNGGGCEGEGHPWLGVGWEQGDVGGSGGTVRRWGRAVKEVDGDDESAIESAELEGLAVEQPPAGGQAAGKRVELRRGDSVKYAAGPAIGADGNRWTGRGKGSRRSSTRERGSGGVSGAEAIAPVAVNTSCTAAAASGNPAGGEPPPSGRRKEKRRGSGSRNAKHLALTNGNRGKGSDRTTAIRQHRPRTHGNGGDGAARRASDGAIQAASSVLAACSSSSTPTSHPRRRIRSLAGGGASGGSGGRFAPDNGNNGGSSSRGGSGSSLSSKGAGGVGGGGRSRGRNGGGNGSSTHGIASSSAAGDLESAPRSGSSLDARDRGAEEAATATGVVKRGGNLRWLSPTDPTAAGGAEANWGGMGSLPPNFVRRLIPNQSPSTERRGNEARTIRQADLGVPEIGNDVARGGGGGATGGKLKAMKGGRVVKGRSILVSGVGERGDATTSTTPMLALPVLEDGGGGSGGGGGGGGGVVARGLGGR